MEPVDPRNWLSVIGMISDAGLAIAYFVIATEILIISGKASRMPPQLLQILRLFELFIASCGVTHLIGIWAWLGFSHHAAHAVSKAAAATVSVYTAIVLPGIAAKSLALILRDVARRLEYEASLEYSNAAGDAMRLIVQRVRESIRPRDILVVAAHEMVASLHLSAAGTTVVLPAAHMWTRLQAEAMEAITAARRQAEAAAAAGGRSAAAAVAARRIADMPTPEQAECLKGYVLLAVVAAARSHLLAPAVGAQAQQRDAGSALPEDGSSAAASVAEAERRARARSHGTRSSTVGTAPADDASSSTYASYRNVCAVPIRCETWDKIRNTSHAVELSYPESAITSLALRSAAGGRGGRDQPPRICDLLFTAHVLMGGGSVEDAKLFMTLTPASSAHPSDGSVPEPTAPIQGPRLLRLPSRQQVGLVFGMRMPVPKRVGEDAGADPTDTATDGGPSAPVRLATSDAQPRAARASSSVTTSDSEVHHAVGYSGSAAGDGANTDAGSDASRGDLGTDVTDDTDGLQGNEDDGIMIIQVPLLADQASASAALSLQRPSDVNEADGEVESAIASAGTDESPHAFGTGARQPPAPTTATGTAGRLWAAVSNFAGGLSTLIGRGRSNSDAEEQLQLQPALDAVPALVTSAAPQNGRGSATNVALPHAAAGTALTSTGQRSRSPTLTARELQVVSHHQHGESALSAPTPELQSVVAQATAASPLPPRQLPAPAASSVPLAAQHVAPQPRAGSVSRGAAMRVGGSPSSGGIDITSPYPRMSPAARSTTMVVDTSALASAHDRLLTMPSNAASPAPLHGLSIRRPHDKRRPSPAAADDSDLVPRGDGGLLPPRSAGGEQVAATSSSPLRYQRGRQSQRQCESAGRTPFVRSGQEVLSSSSSDSDSSGALDEHVAVAVDPSSMTASGRPTAVEPASSLSPGVMPQPSAASTPTDSATPLPRLSLLQSVLGWRARLPQSPAAHVSVSASGLRSGPRPPEAGEWTAFSRRTMAHNDFLPGAWHNRGTSALAGHVTRDSLVSYLFARSTACRVPQCQWRANDPSHARVDGATFSAPRRATNSTGAVRRWRCRWLCSALACA